jgi:hypothetical protein
LALHAGGELMLAGAIAVVMAGGYWWLRRRSSLRLSAWACGALLVATVLLVAAAALLSRSSASSGLPVPLSAAILVVGAALAVAALRLLLDALAKDPAVAARAELAAGCAAAIAIAYLPWVHSFHVFLERPDQTLNRLSEPGAAAVDSLQSVLAQLDLWGIALVAFVIGAGVLLVWLFRGKAPESAMVLMWLGVPLLGFLVLAGPRVLSANVRYFSFLFPAVVLTIALAVEGLALLAAWALERVRPASPQERARLVTVSTAVLLLVLLLQAVPALASSYAIPKDDYRAAAMHVAAASPPGSVVLALGQYSSWATDCFGYYLRQLHANVQVVDSNEINSDNVSNLTAGPGVVWGALVFPTRAELAASADTVRNDFTDSTGDVHLYRATDSSLDRAGQAQALMRWEQPQQPQLSAVVKLLQWIGGEAQLGPNLVTAPGSDGWVLDRQTTTAAGTVTLSPDGSKPDIDATYTAKIAADRDFILQLQCRNALRQGSQSIFAVALDGAGSTLGVYPDGDGLPCEKPADWTRRFFAFDVPNGTAGIKVVLRASGAGVAEFESVELRTLTAG